VSLTAADVAEILRILEQSTFDELSLEINGMKLTLRRGEAPERVDGAAFSEPAPAEKPAASAPPARRAPADPNAQEVTAPLLGTFYRSPKPGAPPFVEVGSKVEEDTVVAIIEVMKLMNTVRAGVRGVVSEVLARDGALVEYGEAILRVRKSG
jgi:acetyl-CoA carboxylase biotin carboxyl carrier protein